ncbi:MAG TPA: carbohydrate-binding family 9-like protein [Flavisolibacter sp.]|nr:carbohydrate-binding family 9-like protein [Flavisolibacter sp.]
MNRVTQLSSSIDTKNPLFIPFLDDAGYSLASIAKALDALEFSSLQYAPWSHSFPYQPVVRFSIAYSHSAVYLKFNVIERWVRAATTEINGPVWEDSCVEFFISFDGQHYYNFEFNCTGTALVGYGSSKEERRLLPVQLIQTIGTHCLIQNKTVDENKNWELTLSIPMKVFLHSSIDSLKGRECLANFYKCGDLLPEPHFICWQQVDSPEPNFHLVNSFGILDFK